MRFHNHSSLLAMTLTLALTLALTTLAHPIYSTSDGATPAAHGQQPLQDYGTHRLVLARPERGTLGWRAEKWEDIVRWWKGEVGGVAEEEEEEEEMEVECGEGDGEDEDGIEEDEEDGQVEL